MVADIAAMWGPKYYTHGTPNLMIYRTSGVYIIFSHTRTNAKAKAKSDQLEWFPGDFGGDLTLGEAVAW